MQRMEPTPRARMAATSSWTHGRWGGFVLLHRRSQLLHVKLTGRLSERTLEEIERRAVYAAGSSRTRFLVLDASRLAHIPLNVARALVEKELGWRANGVVAVWVGLNRYLANLLVLAGGLDQGPTALPDLETAWPLLHDLADDPAPVARGRLEMCSTLVH